MMADPMRLILYFLQEHAKEILAFIVPVFTWGINQFSRAKVQLIYSLVHGFTYLYEESYLDEGGVEKKRGVNAHTSSYLIVNQGRETATKIEVIINAEPSLLNIWPVRNHQRITLADGRVALMFESLSHNEGIRLEMLSLNRELPPVTLVRCDQNVGRIKTLLPQPVLPRWKSIFFRIINVIGIGAAVYLAIELLQVLIIKSG